MLWGGHTFIQRPRHDSTTSRLGQAMKRSMNNLTPNIIFPLAVMYTGGLVCLSDVCVYSVVCRCFCHVCPPSFYARLVHWKVAFSPVQYVMWECYQSCGCNRHSAWELTSWSSILLAVSSMRPVTSTSLQAMQTVIEAFLRSVTIKSTCFCVFISFCTMGICRFHAPQLSLFFLTIFLSSMFSVIPFFYLPLAILIFTPPLLLSFIYLSHFQPSSPPFSCQYCHSCGNLSVRYRPLTTRSLYGTFSSQIQSGFHRPPLSTISTLMLPV